MSANHEMDAAGRTLAPGFIDTHTHDDTSVIEAPGMLPKLSQGVTTVIVGNCGISAAPVRLSGDPPDPMNLLGGRELFRYPAFADYRRRCERRAAGGQRGCVCRSHGTAQQPHGPPRSRRHRQPRSPPCARTCGEALDCRRAGLEHGACLCLRQCRAHRGGD